MRFMGNYLKWLEAAAAWAAQLHAWKGQTYGEGLPYAYHLQAVETVLVRFGFSDPDNPVHQALRMAAHSHDLLEDVDVDPVTLRVLQGPDVFALVEAVTQEPGPTREVRVARTLPKTRAAGPWAVVLKLADRIANVEASRPGDRHTARYLREHPAFWEGLYVPGEPGEEMWVHLDRLIEAARAQAPPAEPAPAPPAPIALEQAAWIV